MKNEKKGQLLNEGEIKCVGMRKTFRSNVGKIVISWMNGVFNWLWNSKKNENKSEKEDTLTTILLTTDELMDRKELGIEPESDCILGPFRSNDSCDSSDSNDTNSTSDSYEDADSNNEDKIF